MGFGFGSITKGLSKGLGFFPKASLDIGSSLVGGVFGGAADLLGLDPKIPKVPPPPSLPSALDTLAIQEEIRKKGGRNQTIFTSGLGVPGNASTASARLLGV